MGVERIAMIQHGISDIGHFYSRRHALPGAVRMNILSNWLRNYVPGITVDDRQLAET